MVIVVTLCGDMLTVKDFVAKSSWEIVTVYVPGVIAY